jgi:hypothetical protein
MLRTILLFIIGLQTAYGQNFTGQVFLLAEHYQEDKCAAIAEGDCDTGDLFFLTDKQFCLVAKCIFNDSYYIWAHI